MKRSLPVPWAAAALWLTGCQPDISSAPIIPQSEVCEDRSTITVGDLPQDKIEALKASLQQTTFPAPQGTIARLLDSKLKPVPVHDAAIPDNPSRHTSGELVDFWLNDSAVLRVSTYYFAADKSRALEEWAVVLSPRELDTYHRGFCDTKPAKGSPGHS